MDQPFTAYRGGEPYIFVSYSHKDSPAVFSELTRLKDHGFNIWYDEGIEAGTEWREELAHAIKQARLFLYFVTRASVQSEHCRQELNFAKEEHIPVLAVHLEHCELSVGVKLTLSDRQAILKYEMTRQEYERKLPSRIESYLNPQTIEPLNELQDRSKEFDLTVMHTIAVLPFTNMSTNTDTGFFADGLSEDILDNLAQIDWLMVAARSASFQFSEPGQDPGLIGRRLKVAYLLEGSIRQRGTSLRITAQLVRGDDGFHVWSKTYDRTLADGFEMQTSVATNIANFVQSELEFDVFKKYGWKQVKRLDGINSIAIDHFISARNEYRKFLLADGGIWDAYVQFLKNAVEADAGFYAAYELLANAYLQRHLRGRLTLGVAGPAARAAIEAATAINPDRVDRGFSTEAQILLSLELDYRSASDAFRRDLQNTPRHGWANLHLASIDVREGRSRDALRQLANATELTVPETPLFLAFTAWIRHVCGDNEAALSASTLGLKLAPAGRDREFLLRMHATSLISSGRIEEARGVVEEGWYLGRGLNPESYICLFAYLGEAERARKILTDPRFELIDKFQVAIGYLALEETDNTFASIGTGMENHSPSLIESIQVAEWWNPIRDDPRFDEMLDLLDSKVTHTEQYLRDHKIAQPDQ